MSVAPAVVVIPFPAAIVIVSPFANDSGVPEVPAKESVAIPLEDPQPAPVPEITPVFDTCRHCVPPPPRLENVIVPDEVRLVSPLIAPPDETSHDVVSIANVFAPPPIVIAPDVVPVPIAVVEVEELLLIDVVPETVNPVNVPTDVKDDVVTPEFNVVPVNVPAAAVTVISAEPSNETPLIFRAVCRIVAVPAFPDTDV